MSQIARSKNEIPGRICRFESRWRQHIFDASEDCPDLGSQGDGAGGRQQSIAMPHQQRIAKSLPCSLQPLGNGGLRKTQGARRARCRPLAEQGIDQMQQIEINTT